ncbi:tropomyosin-2-like [Montipora capricornis]|uniref:tropomyosin-2-like n=1 Tax=Montipora capricornis TaxID=246305 RepID=UPI0035F12C5B
MENLLKKILEKKRSKRSSSGESSTSPDAKKAKSGDVNFPEAQEHEADDEIFTALNMAEGLQKTLEEINRKLEKLDAIQITVNDAQASLQKLEGRIQKLECSQTTAKRDIENLTESFKAAEKKQQKSAASLKDHREKTNLALTDLQKVNDDLQAKLKEIEDKNLYLEAYSRRENIIFENILQVTDKEDTESVVRIFLETELGYKDANTVEIQRVHRLGKKRDKEKPRQIIARFLRYKDCEEIFSVGFRLRRSTFKMYQDLPYEIVARRRKQMNTFKEARKNNIPASFSRAQPDKLFIKGKLWPVG